MVCLPVEFYGLLNLRRSTPATRPQRGCPPQCAESLQGRSERRLDSVALRNLEEELKQTSAARKLICNAIQGKPMGLLPRQSCVTGLGRPV